LPNPKYCIRHPTKTKTTAVLHKTMYTFLESLKISITLSYPRNEVHIVRYGHFPQALGWFIGSGNCGGLNPVPSPITAGNLVMK
jgi:hypothetical protein